jgi:hypothetical protein
MLGAAGFINSALTWLLGRYFLLRYNDIMYSTKAHIYDALSLAVLALCCTAGHYYAAALLKRIYPSDRDALPAKIIAFLVLCSCTLYAAQQLSLRPAPLAVLPVIGGYLAGGRSGWRVPPEKDPFRKWFQ